MLRRSGETSTVQTTPVKLESYELPPNVEFTSGAQNTSIDRVAGIWLRAHNTAGELLLDPPNLTTLRNKHECKE